MISQIRALTFDVFGTTVDWREGVARETLDLQAEHEFDVVAADFVDLATRLGC